MAKIDLAHVADFALGDAKVAPSRCVVMLGDGTAEQLEPRVMQVLVALGNDPGRVISRVDLEASCWSGHIVSDDALNRVISRLRRLSVQSGELGFTLTTLPRVGYRVDAVAGAGIQTRDDPLIAVLPFANASSDPGLQWLSDGISEEILQAIARSTSIRVIGRSSSFHLKGAVDPIAAVRDQLKATHALDGMVQRQSGKTRVSAELIDTASQAIIWSDRIEIDRADEFTIQDTIAERVALALDRTFAAAARPPEIDAVGYELYLRGAELTRDITPKSQGRAIALLEAAAKLIPELADAWGNLALARTQAAFFLASEDSRKTALVEAARALALDPECRTARLVSYVGGSIFDFSSHRGTFERPKPSNFGRTASPDVSFGVQMLELGHIVEALEFFNQAERFDPFFQILNFYQAHAFLAHGDIDEGLERLDRAIARWPSVPFFLAARLKWAAVTGDWKKVETVDVDRRDHSLQHLAGNVSTWIAFCREPNISAGGLDRLREAAFGIGTSGLQELLLHARYAGLSNTLTHLADRGAPLVRTEAPRTPDDLGAIALWLPLFSSIRRDPAFGIVLQAVGLTVQSPLAHCAQEERLETTKSHRLDVGR